MRVELKPIVRSMASAGVMTLALGMPAAFAANPCNPCAARPAASRAGSNPCAAKNPCAARNPCAAKNPCAARNPCAAKNPCAPRGPCGAKSPCGAGDKVASKLVTRPKGTKPYQGKRAELVKSGEALWKDTKLSTNGLACNSCHQNNAAFNPSFAKPYPHAVAMASEKSGLKRITAEQMVQFCMIVPMAAKPLPWDSKQLAALTAYTLAVQKGFKANPCAAKNPCAARNPCAAKNPCAARNPCGAKR